MLIIIQCNRCGAELFVDSGHIVQNDTGCDEVMCDVCHDEWLLLHNDSKAEEAGGENH